MRPSLQKKKDRKVVENFSWITKSSVLDIIIIFFIVAAIVTIIWAVLNNKIDLSFLMFF